MGTDVSVTFAFFYHIVGTEISIVHGVYSIAPVVMALVIWRFVQ